MSSEELKKEWRSKVAELVGEASICWTELPQGVFESERAKRIVDDIMLILAKQQEEFVKIVENAYSIGGIFTGSGKTKKEHRMIDKDNLLADIKNKLNI
jgi:hypothetical protein